jgi:uncharacterized protein Usg
VRLAVLGQYLVVGRLHYPTYGVQWQQDSSWQPPWQGANTLFWLIFIWNQASFDQIASKRGVQMQKSETELMLKGYGLTTAELYYRMPDYRSVLNSFIWQDYDLAPDYPALFRFIEFWQEKLDGPLHSVRFTHRKLIAPGEWRNVVGELRLH